MKWKGISKRRPDRPAVRQNNIVLGSAIKANYVCPKQECPIDCAASVCCAYEDIYVRSTRINTRICGSRRQPQIAQPGYGKIQNKEQKIAVICISTGTNCMCGIYVMMLDPFMIRIEYEPIVCF